MFSKLKCSNCGAENDKKSTFCSECGNPLAGIVCSSCGTQIGAEYKFCPNCGATITQVTEQRSSATQVSEERGKIRVWKRNPNDFAHRFEISDIKGLFSKKITVMSGTKAIFLQGGRFLGELTPGPYTVGGLTQAIKNLNFAEKATVILVDDSDVGLDFAIDGLRTKESFDAGVKGKIVVNIEEPILLFNNLMKGREHLATAEIEALLRNEMLNVLQSKVKQYSFEDLYGNLELKNELEQDFVHLLHTTLSRVGLKLVHMPYFDYDESYWKDLIKDGAEIEKRVRIEDIDDERLRLTERIRARLTKDKMDEFSNAEDLEKFVHELDKEKIIREAELNDLKQIFEDNRGDRAFAREWMFKRLDVQNALDLNRMIAEYEREKRREGNKIDEEEAKMGIRILEELKAAKREDAAGYQEIELKKQQKMAELEEQRLKARSAATDEAIISMTEGKQAEHVSELARMKLATGLTDEQILALGAKDSAAIAEAFKERYKSKSAEEIMRIYEDRLRDKDEFARTIQEIADKGGGRMERMAEKALEQMGITAATRAQGATGGGTTVVSGGGGQPVVVGGTVSPAPPTREVEKVVMCPECNAELPVGTRFCTNCGAAVGKREG